MSSPQSQYTADELQEDNVEFVIPKELELVTDVMNEYAENKLQRCVNCGPVSSIPCQVCHVLDVIEDHGPDCERCAQRDRESEAAMLPLFWWLGSS